MKSIMTVRCHTKCSSVFIMSENNCELRTNYSIIMISPQNHTHRCQSYGSWKSRLPRCWGGVVGSLGISI